MSEDLMEGIWMAAIVVVIATVIWNKNKNNG
jgi:hypothetical protein